MANYGAILQGGVKHANVTNSGSVQASWVTVIPTANGTVASVGVLESPLTSLAAGTLPGGAAEVANINPVRVPLSASRVMARVRYDYNVGLVNAQARIRLYSIYGGLNRAGNFASDDGSTYQQILRLDNVSGVANGIAFACDPATDLGDLFYRYSTPMDFSGGSDVWTIDLHGASYLLVLLDRAMVDDGGFAPAIDIAFLN